jgi:hypothetical protein
MSEALAPSVGNAQTPPTRLQESLRQLYPPHQIEAHELPAKTPGVFVFDVDHLTPIIEFHQTQERLGQASPDYEPSTTVEVDIDNREWLAEAAQTVNLIPASLGESVAMTALFDIVEARNYTPTQPSPAEKNHGASKTIEPTDQLTSNTDSLGPLETAIEATKQNIIFDEKRLRRSIGETLEYAGHIGTMLEAISLHGEAGGRPIVREGKEIYLTTQQHEAKYTNGKTDLIRTITMTVHEPTADGATQVTTSLTVPVGNIGDRADRRLLEISQGPLSSQLLVLSNRSDSDFFYWQPLKSLAASRGTKRSEVNSSNKQGHVLGNNALEQIAADTRALLQHLSTEKNP